MTTEPLYHYVVVRADLPRGAQAAQIVHAAGESVLQPVPGDTRAVVLTCATQGEIGSIATVLELAGIVHKRIFETDGGFAGQLVAIGLNPQPKTEDLKRCLGGLSILK